MGGKLIMEKKYYALYSICLISEQDYKNLVSVSGIVFHIKRDDNIDNNKTISVPCLRIEGSEDEIKKSIGDICTKLIDLNK